MVGGRHVPTILLVGTLLATWIGSGSLIGFAGLAYRQGFAELWASAGAWAAIVVVYFLAGRVRHIAEYTLPDLLEKRYHPAARIFGSITVIIASVTICGYQFKGGGMVLNLVANIPMEYGIIITAIFVVTFTVLAGMMSIVSIDIINGIMILVGVLVAVIVLFFGVGGVAGMKEALPATHFEIFGANGPMWALAIFFPVFFLLLGESSMYQKFFSAKDEKAARRACIGWVVGTIIIEGMICLLAILGSIKFPDLKDSETIILHIARNGLPVWAGVILLAAGIAIIISTANSFLLTPATNLTHDIIQRFFIPNASQKTIILVNRLSVVFLGFVAYLLLTQFKTVLSMALTAYTMIGAGITPAILAAFLWKRVTAAGGMASILGGMAATVATKIAFDLPSVQAHFADNYGIAELSEYMVLPPLVVSLVLLIVVSLLTPKPPEEKWKPFMSGASS
jgi:SSS family solute:Na+ symporter/sodium/proline symporter